MSKSPAIQWTDQQLAAIAARDRDVLVTASAGTGKTAVLSARCVRLLSDKKLAPDILSVLVLTFTEAAAAQMKDRIAKQLKEAYLQTRDHRLYQQLMLVPAADISTIHAFCKRLITEHFYHLDIDPAFRVMDEDEAMLLKNRTLEKTMDWAWRQPNLAGSLAELLQYRNVRDERGFLPSIIELSDDLDSIIQPQNWFTTAQRMLEPQKIKEQKTEFLKNLTVETLMHAIERTEMAIQLANHYSDKNKFQSQWHVFIKSAEQLISELKNNPKDLSEKIDECVESLPSSNKPRSLQDDNIKKQFDELSKKTKTQIKSLSQYLSSDSQFDAVAIHQTKIMLELLQQFRRLYRQAKKQLNTLDFSDLEHQSLALLSESDNPSKPSTIAKTLQQRYRFIFIDEYQDINPVQQAILSLLTAGENMFMVGDVKQSIYAFRGARPDYFLQTYHNAVNNKQPKAALPIPLQSNFRSEKRLLDFVNQVFGRIMTKSFAGIDYDKHAELLPGTDINDHTDAPCVEIHLLDKSFAPDNQDDSSNDADRSTNMGTLNASRLEAKLAAEKIQALVQSQDPKDWIYDKEIASRRPVEYRDIVVLMRSPASRANIWTEIFQLCGIPVDSQSASGFLAATEIADCLSLLKLLDNPRRDIELAAVLRSPFFNFSDSDLAKIRIFTDPKATPAFYDAVFRYQQDGSDTTLKQKLSDFFQKIAHWRKHARNAILADLIWDIFHQSGYLAYVQALPNGPQRYANLLKFHERAIQFEGFAASAGHLSLIRFIEFIEQLEQNARDWAPAKTDSSAQNTVRIMSIHKSKGLEFPVVILAELDSPFSTKDSRLDAILDEHGLLGLKVIDPDAKVKQPSILWHIATDHRQKIARQEEMRILYVAMTRAKNRLIITASGQIDRIGRDIRLTNNINKSTLPDFLLADGKSHLDWLITALGADAGLLKHFSNTEANQPYTGDIFTLHLYRQFQLVEFAEAIENLRLKKVQKPQVCKKAASAETQKQIDTLRQNFQWRYSYPDAVHIAAKQSVSDITHQADEYRRPVFTPHFERKPRILSADENTITGAQVGTATHLILSKLDVSQPVTAESISKTVKECLDDRMIDMAAARQIDINAILKFFECEPGQLLLDTNNAVHREWSFTFACPANEISDSANDEKIIIQGIIDCLVLSAKGFHVIDFKTDHITESQLPQRVESYRTQLMLYTRAAQAILKQKPLGIWLHFLAIDRPINLKEFFK